MTYQPYKPFLPETIGNSISCQTLARMLNEIGDTILTRKVVANIARYFGDVRRLSLSIPSSEVRAYVGHMMVRHIKHFEPNIIIPERIGYVLKNVKYAYVKDMMISVSPRHYTRKLKHGEELEMISEADDKKLYWFEDSGV